MHNKTEINQDNRPFYQQWEQFDVKRAAKGLDNLKEMLGGLSPDLRDKMMNNKEQTMEIINLFMGIKPVWLDHKGQVLYSEEDDEEIKNNVGKYYKRVLGKYFVNVDLCLNMLKKYGKEETDSIEDETALVEVFKEVEKDLAIDNCDYKRNDRAHRILGMCLGYPKEDVVIFNSADKNKIEFDSFCNEDELGWHYGSYSSQRRKELNDCTKKLLVDTGAYSYICEDLKLGPSFILLRRGR